ncbi:Tfp pilus assembly protein PilF [Alkalithermobacter thermoalcaliphilus JW-YL-7 = DSM 7308]|uniref:Tetratricopeptide TPR_1 repeat-containing protein n=1 Tax=Alkalithermobacter thermoalcaliphilus JW-YL-7 = DSM 7308 TaxID=1121328 RepID=A0A150FNZ9_CLOPD|nr:Tetratricopeptide TPR_1 repeat-containing protein [[Clostridium] paradoxum JW-YL-7 = DSM 7308]SHK54935.1 Tfp pilus assembly protein PilF [[Clostridium] paradoxum JW-YL-7 = DSM 7308]
MRFRIDKYLLKNTQNVSFLTIKSNAELNLKGYKIPNEGIDVPILNEELVKNIKEKKEPLTLASIARGMIYIIGIDHSFRYNEEYKKFLYAFDSKIEDYIGHVGVKKAHDKKFIDSLIYFKALITLNKENINALYNYAIICQDIARSYEKTRQTEKMNDYLLEALDKLETIIDIEENFSLAYYQLGYHYHNQKQYVKAKLTWEKAIETGLDDDKTQELKEHLNKIQYKVDYEEGYNLVLNGQAQRGLEKLLPLTQNYSDWWNLLFFIGLAYRQLNDINKAIEYFEKVLAINPNQADTLAEIGLCNAVLGKYDKAIEYYEKSIEILGEQSELLCNLGMVYLQINNIEKASEYIQRAYELDPNDEITISCLKELSKFE